MRAQAWVGMLVLGALTSIGFTACGGGGDSTTVITQKTVTQVAPASKGQSEGNDGSSSSSTSSHRSNGGNDGSSSSSTSGKSTTVPDLVGERLDVAKRDLRDMGLRPVQIDDEGTAFGIVLPENWTVCRMRPAAGASLSSGQSVDLYAKKSGC